MFRARQRDREKQAGSKEKEKKQVKNWCKSSYRHLFSLGLIDMQ